MRLVSILGVIALASAHFQITFPTPRNGVEANEGTAPCGAAPMSSNRTLFNYNTPISLESTHTAADFTVLLGTTTDDSNFNVTVVPWFNMIGLGNFCMTGVQIPSSIANGTNATLQIVQNGDGILLFQCIDIIVDTNGPTQAAAGACVNGTNVSAGPATPLAVSMLSTPIPSYLPSITAAGTASGSAPGTVSQSPTTSASAAASSSAPASSSSAAAAASSSKSAASSLAPWSLLGALIQLVCLL